MNNKRIDIRSATTPPNFLGIERKIAYAKRKYHSGWMWAGVTKGFAGIKFSASMKTYPRVNEAKSKRKR